MAKNAWPVCPECGSRYFTEDKSRGEKICAKCGLILEESVIDVSQEWRAFDDEQRSKRARTGAPLTFSVDYEEPIIIKENGEIKVVKIGKFTDEIIEKNKDKVVKQGILEVVFLKNSDIQAVSFDKDYKTSFHPIKEVSRHPIKEIYEVEIEGGKKVKVTGSHSAFTVVDNEIVPIRVDNLAHGNFLVAPKHLPSENIKLEIDLLEEFKKIAGSYDNIYLRHITDEGIFFGLDGVTKRQIKNWKRHRTIPLHVLANSNINFKTNGEKIGIYSSTIELPLKLKISKDICKLLGYYVSEGESSEHLIRFSFGAHERNYIDEVKSIMKLNFGLDINEYNHGSSVQLEVKSKLLSLFFSDILRAGKNAREKRIPPIIFSLPEEMKLAFIHGYVNGDGHTWEREGTRDTQVGTITANKDLADDLLMLYLQLGVHANYCEAHIPSHTIQKTGQVLSNSIAHIIRITNPDLAVKMGFVNRMPKRKRKEAIEELIPAPLKYKKEWKSRKRIRIGKVLAIKIAKKHGDKYLLKLARAPFIFLRVKTIKKIKSSNGYAYDLTIHGCENFAGKIFYHNTKHDKGMTTEIGKGPGELFKVASGKRAQYYRLSKWQKRLVESKDRNLSFALSELQRLISFLGLPRGVHEEVAKKYEQAVDWGLVRGRSMESVIAALLYAVCRELGTPRTLEEIAEASGVERREIGRTYRYIARELTIRILPASPEHFVPRFASMLGLSDHVQAKAIQILKKAKKDHVTSGKGPTGVAAAALYIAAVLHGEKKTQREIADAVGVTEVTIRNRFKELVDDLGIAEEIEKRVKEVEK